MSGQYGYIGPQAMPPNMQPPPAPPSMLSAGGNNGAAMHGMDMDPTSNNMPLQFNMNKNKPPMAIPGGPEGNGHLPHGEYQVMGDASDPSTAGQVHGMMGHGGQGMMGPGGPGMMGPGPGGHMGFNPMMNDPNMMMGMQGMGMGFDYGMGMQAGMGMQQGTAGLGPKEVLTFKSCVLYPPPPNAVPPSTRERPPGCRTIFVGGLPETCTEDFLREVFDSCGGINSIRVSKKSFAHIRFDFQESVEKSLYISGYRMKVEDKDDKENTGRLHVDYAQARDDLYEWECEQRALDREMRHQQRMEEEARRPPSPPPVAHFSMHEANNLLEQLKGDLDFVNGTNMLAAWLERGDVSRRTANTFYSIIQSVNAHHRRLLTEKMSHDMEYEQLKMAHKQKLEGIVKQFDLISKVMQSASKQKCWDHFSKAQRKNIDGWKKSAEEMARYQQDEFLRDREEAEMDLSDDDKDEAPPAKKQARAPVTKTEEQTMEDFKVWHYEKLKEEKEELYRQLEAYKNEVAVLKNAPITVIDDKEEKERADQAKNLKLLQQTLQGMQQQLMEAKRQNRGAQEELASMKLKQCLAEQADRDTAKDKDPVDQASVPSEAGATDTSDAPAASSSSAGDVRQINEREAKLIGLIATFLHVHPFGASVDYICSYLQRLEFSIRAGECELLLERLPSVFRQELKGVGAMLERRWKFLGFEQAIL